jgi:hypothetical protein
MPPYSMITSAWLRQILRGEKKLLKASEAKICNPPKYDEVSVANLYEPCLELDRMEDYFPDKYPIGRTCCREYFFTILATLHPEYTRELLRKSKSDRFALNDEEQQKEAILIDPEWEAQLKEFPQFCRKYISSISHPYLYGYRLQGQDAPPPQGEDQDRSGAQGAQEV